jgi:hypothetical protein
VGAAVGSSVGSGAFVASAAGALVGSSAGAGVAAGAQALSTNVASTSRLNKIDRAFGFLDISFSLLGLTETKDGKIERMFLGVTSSLISPGFNPPDVFIILG